MTFWIRAAAAAVCLAALAPACSAPARGGPAAPTIAAPAAVRFELKTVAQGLEFPWGLVVLPGGDMLVTERNAAQVRLVRGGALAEAPALSVPEVFVAGQGGLFDLALHPQFAENGWVYITYATGTAEANGTRLARARWTGERLEGFEVLFTAGPLKRGPAHFGGRLLFLPDGTLLLSLGEGFRERDQAQKPDSHLGKVLRLTDAGAPAPGNPFLGQADARPEIFSLGHRNVQGLARDPATGVIWAHEHGPRGGDEVNVLAAGRNYGWPLITYGVDYTGAEITPFTERPGLEQPQHVWTPSIAPSGLAFYDGAAFPAWRGSLFTTALAGQKLVRLTVEGGRITGQEDLLADQNLRLRHVVQSPEGDLLLLTDSLDGAIVRLTPAAR